MYCVKCGKELPSASSFCPSCGEPVPRVANHQNTQYIQNGQMVRGAQNVQNGQIVPGGQNVQNAFHNTVKDVSNAAVKGVKSLNTSKNSLALAEGILSIILALLVLFAPVIRVSMFGFGSSSNVLGLTIRLSALLHYANENSIWLILLAVLNLATVVSTVINAARCFERRKSQAHSFKKALKFKWNDTLSDTVTVYAICLLLLMWYVSSQSYGIAGSTGWTWVLLLGGMVNMALDFAWKNA